MKSDNKSWKRTITQSFRHGRAQLEKLLRQSSSSTTTHHPSPTRPPKTPKLNFFTKFTLRSSSPPSSTTPTLIPTSRPSTPSPSYASPHSSFISPKQPVSSHSPNTHPLVSKFTNSTTQHQPLDHTISNTNTIQKTTTTSHINPSIGDLMSQLRSHQIEWSAMMMELEKWDPHGTLSGMTARQIRRLIQQKRSQTWLTETDGPLYEHDELEKETLNQMVHFEIHSHDQETVSESPDLVQSWVNHVGVDVDDDDITRYGSSHSSLTHYHQALEPSEHDDWSQYF